MRKSPQEKPGGLGEKTAPCDWMLMALQTLAARKAVVSLTQTADIEGMSAMRSRPKLLVEHPLWNLHKHPTPELCLALAGAPILALQDYICTPGIAVIGAGVMHCEARVARSEDSALLWIVPARSSIGLAVSKYDKMCGWNLAWRYSFHDESVIAFRRALDRLAEAADDLDALCAELMLVLTVVYRDLVTQSQASSVTDQKAAMLNHVKDYLDANLEKPISLKQVASMNQLTPNYLNSLFNEWQGKGIHAYLIERRMEKAMQLCRKSKMAIKEVAATVGFTDALYFSKAFHDYHGIWPSQLKSR